MSLPRYVLHDATRRGSVLIVVLAVLILLTVLIVTFLAEVTSARVSSANYSAVANTRILADTVVNLVQAEINEATTPQSGASSTWASQPGAIRTYDNTGALTAIFRLYSSSAVEAANSGQLAGDLPPADWADSPASWVDLNAPVTVTGMTDANGNAVPQYTLYPILDNRDPNNLNAPVQIPGFFVNTVGGGSAFPSSTTTLNPPVMPVRWLYVLQDGRIIPPDSSSSGTQATFSSAPEQPSASNRIVGRVAYWTDDETAKLNINTAGSNFSQRPDNNNSGTATALPASWDTPRFAIWDELKLFSENQPSHGEYQRYPGHPASTDLYNLFNALHVDLTGGTTAQPFPANSSTYDSGNDPMPDSTPTALFPLLPRYSDDNTSMGGVRNTTTSQANPFPAPKRDRLYASVGELLYTPARTANGIGTTATLGLTRQQLETGKFFLTAHNPAPDVTLFGTPRVSMWPIDSDFYTVGSTATTVSTFDKVVAFCSSYGGSGANANGNKAFIFQRHDSTSATNDASIARNQQLYSYLQALGGGAIPGFGGTLASKYGANGEINQILTEMVDYIRSTNTYDHSIVDPDPSSGQSPYPRFTPGLYQAGNGQVTPLHITTTSGLGRTFTISEIGVLTICTADGNSTLGAYQAPVAGISPVKGSAYDAMYVSNLPVAQYLRDTSNNIVGLDANGNTVAAPASGVSPFPANPTLAATFGGTATALTPGQKRLQSMLIIELSCPMLGNNYLTMPSLQIAVSGLENIPVAGVSPFPTSSDGSISLMGARINTYELYGGTQPFQLTLGTDPVAGTSRVNGWSNPTAASRYPFVSNPYTVSTTDQTTDRMAFGGAKAFVVNLLTPAKSGGSANPLQTFNVSFPSAQTPFPDLPQYGLNIPSAESWTGLASSKPSDWWGFDYRISHVGSSFNANAGGSLPVLIPSVGAGGGQLGTLGPGCVIRTDLAPPAAGKWTYLTNAPLSVVLYKDTQGNKTPTASLPPSDVIRTLVAKDGDIRLLQAKQTVTADGTTDMVADAGYNDTSYKLVDHLMLANGGSGQVPGFDASGKLYPNAQYALPFVPKTLGSVTPLVNWDWDSGMPLCPDGAYGNKPDEGNTYIGSGAPYYNSEQAGTVNTSYFSANRIIPSPVMFGSLPTGVDENVTWRTLLFRPAKNSNGSYIHDTLSGPSDYLFLDWFNMPIVEPYAISEPFATAGRVNMNYQIVPFTYITRDTAVRAVLESELVPRVPLGSEEDTSTGWPSGNALYKGQPTSATPIVPPSTSPLSGAQANANGVSMTRLTLNLDENTGTLAQFQSVFAGGDIFRSPAQICDIYLVPQGYSWPGFDNLWYGTDFAMVGDNARERPYADIYPRLTTKSNTFTVHYRVQALRVPPTADATTWNESVDVVTGEYRGSTTLERYLDPNNTQIPDYTSSPLSQPSLDTYYQWRTVSNTAFSP